MIKIQSLKTICVTAITNSFINQNKQFLNILKKKRINNNYFTIYYGKNNDEIKNKILKISFVTKKKIGNAVKRNKIRRRLKSAVQKILTNDKNVNLNYNYIIFGKDKVYSEKFSILSNNIESTFKKIKNLNN